MSSKPFITIITATYNRRDTLFKAYDSLKKQTDKNFVWLIVDDGSTDRTKEVVEQWIDDDEIAIEYILQKNMGVNAARNVGILNTETEWLTKLDSDDYYSTDFVSKMLEYITKYSGEIDDNCAGFLFPTSGNITTDLKEGKHTLMEQYYTYMNVGEYQIVHKTSVAKRFMSVTFVGEKFVAEDSYLQQIDFYYHYLCFNERFMHREYREDGITENINDLYLKNAYGRTYAMKINASYCTAMGKMRRAKVYSDYKKMVKNVLEFDDTTNIFPEIHVPRMVQMLSFMMYENTNILQRILLNRKYPFPAKQIKRHDKIVMWGAGSMGQAFETYMRTRRYGELLLWIDGNYVQKRSLGLNVDKPSSAANYMKKADYFLVAILSDNEAKKVESDLLEMGVERQKIVRVKSR